MPAIFMLTAIVAAIYGTTPCKVLAADHGSSSMGAADWTERILTQQELERLGERDWDLSPSFIGWYESGRLAGDTCICIGKQDDWTMAGIYSC